MPKPKKKPGESKFFRDMGLGIRNPAEPPKAGRSRIKIKEPERVLTARESKFFRVAKDLAETMEPIVTIEPTKKRRSPKDDRLVPTVEADVPERVSRAVASVPKSVTYGASIVVVLMPDGVFVYKDRHDYGARGWAFDDRSVNGHARGLVLAKVLAYAKRRKTDVVVIDGVALARLASKVESLERMLDTRDKSIAELKEQRAGLQRLKDDYVVQVDALDTQLSDRQRTIDEQAKLIKDLEERVQNQVGTIAVLTRDPDPTTINEQAQTIAQQAEMIRRREVRIKELEDWSAAQGKTIDALMGAGVPQSIPMILHCPDCGHRHIDSGEWSTRVHKTHACQACGFVWRPAKVATVGVQHLPGFGP